MAFFLSCKLILSRCQTISIKKVCAILGVCLVGSVSVAQAENEEVIAQESCIVGVKVFNKTVKETYRLKDWKNGPTEEMRRKLGNQLACAASSKSRDKMKNILSERKKFFKLYVKYRHVATVPGLEEGDIWLEWLVIPPWVVQAETRGYYGKKRWYAKNPTGACGPYQLLGHTSCDVSSPEDKVRHHIVAAGLPRGSWEVGY